MRRKILSLFVAVIYCAYLSTPIAGLAAADPVLHTSLDASNPIQFYGTYIIYNGQRIDLGPNALYVDGSMPDSIANQYPYVFNNFDTDVVGQNFNGIAGADFGSKAIVPYLNSDAVKTLGTEENPVVVYMAPYVYWGDNWADPATRMPTDPGGLYGITINCKWLNLVGLTDNRDKVVICGDRGQTNGSNGNWTLFNITGDGLRTDHITIANYCNIDLDYPLKPALNHPKRTSTICQAQLVSYSGDKAIANDTSFKSRLNLMPFSGTRTLYDNCHFESTDDSISGTAVYLNCDFDLYGTMPAYSLNGAIFLNSTFRSHIIENVQGLSKSPGPGALIDAKFIRDSQLTPITIVWSPYADSKLPTLRGYQSNVTLNGQPITVSAATYGMTVDITNSPDALSAYKFTYQGKTYYNTYNLLRGTDNWDPKGTTYPSGIKNIVDAVSAETGKDLGNVPIRLAVSLKSGSSATIDSGATTTLTTALTRNLPTQAGTVTWSVYTNPDDASYAILPANPTGSSVTITGHNTDELPRVVTVTASTYSGLVGAYNITINPTLVDPPTFTADPLLAGPTDGKMAVSYSLDLGARTDMSLITWYRCTDAQGSNAIPVAVTRMNEPEKTYTLTDGDVGYYLMAKVEPKHVRSNPGPAKTAIAAAPITSADVKVHYIETNFQNFSVTPQKNPLPGFWMVDAFNPPDTYDVAAYPNRSFQKYTPTTGAAMEYKTGQDGAVGYGLIGTSQGGRILYTPTGKAYGDMKVQILADPEKTAGQGFGSANSCYADLFIKYDTATQTGYSVRVERTKAQANGVEISLMKHTNGYSSYLPLDVYGSVDTEGKTTVRTSGYVAPSTLTVWTEGDKLYATIRSDSEETPGQVAAGLIHDADLRATITPNSFGGAGYINTGTVSAGNRTMLHKLRIDWNPDETAPTWSADSTLTASNTTKNGTTLTWASANDNVVVAGYNIYNGTALIGTVAADVYSYDVTGLNAHTTYNFAVKAVDAAGNLSDALTVTETTKSSHSGGSGGTTTPPATTPPTTTPPTTTPPTTTPPTTTPGDNTGTPATVEVGKPTLDASTGKAQVTVDEKALSDALSKTVGVNGVKTVVIEIPKVEGATSYTPVLPASALTLSDTAQKLELKTEFGTATVPGNMLANTDIAGAKEIGINIAKADTTKLPADVKESIGSRPVIDLSVSVDGKKVEFNNPNAQVKVAIPYSPLAEELKNPEHIVALYIDGNGKAIPVPSGRYDAAARAVVFTTTHFSQYTIAYVNKTFGDIASYDWAKNSIEVMAGKGIINGTSDNTFTPEKNITRADFIVLLIKSLGLTAKVDSNFSDINTTDYYYEAVGIAKVLGIAKGQGNNCFNPSEEISRQDMMVITARAMKLADKISSTGSSEDLSVFSDNSSVSDYAAADIGTMVKEGLVKGDNGIINPLGNATRAEAAVLMYRVYNK